MTEAKTKAHTATSNKPLSVDITVVGAGLVGLAAALACHEAGYSVALVDRGPAPGQLTTEQDPATPMDLTHWDARIYAISPNNANWLTALGVWPLLAKARIGQIDRMQIFADASPLNLAAEDGLAACLAYVIEAQSLMRALLQRIQASGIPVLFGQPCAKLSSTSEKTHLILADNRQLSSRLLIAADGSQSWVRQQLPIAVQHKSYEQRAIVANFTVEKPHANVARQWFSGNEQTGHAILAWLPLPNNTISIVWSVSLAYADQLLNLSDAEFTLAVMQAGGEALGQMHLQSPPQAFPLSMQSCEAIAHDGVVLVGDAAHQVHPMAGQGVNLGFRDVIDLLASLREKHSYQSVADKQLLKAYTRRRKADVLAMQCLTDGLFQVFASRQPWIKRLRNLAWSAADHRLIKKKLLAYATEL